MSVINQMLKDLDKRQQEPVQPSSARTHVVVKQGHSQRWVIAILVLLLAISLGIILWQKLATPANEQATVVASTSLQNQLVNSASVEKVSEKAIDNQSVGNNNTAKLSPSASTQIKTEVLESQISEPRQTSLTEKTEKAEVQQATIAAVQKKELVQNVLDTSLTAVESKAEQTVEPTLTISRKQLTPDQLASKKIAQAEQAIANKDIIKAEQLFEDVLLIVPSHKSARKQLAALWFGKQSYQAALNLLSQGLALDNQDAEFRLMKARIYLSQGQAQLALNVLQVLDNIRLVEYQSLLASTAQQLRLFAPAEKAYSILTELAPNVGRWWLGLAIAQDSQSQFTEAINSYQNALHQQNLSSETAQFAKNRIIELGE